MSNDKRGKFPPNPVFPDLCEIFKASEDEIRTAIDVGTMHIGFDRAKDGTETTVEGYLYNGKFYITDEFQVPPAPLG
jgi:hypothetical protein